MGSRIERQRNIVDFAISCLLRRKGKNMALVFVYTVVICLMASVLFITYSINKEASFLFQDSPELIVQRIIAGRHDVIPISHIQKAGIFS